MQEHYVKYKEYSHEYSWARKCVISGHAPFKETGSAMFGLQRFSSSVEEEDGELEEALGLVML